MKRKTILQKIILLFFIISIYACKKDNNQIITPKKIDGFHIYGTIPSFEGKTILLQKEDLEKKLKIIDRTIVKNNQFQFQGKNDQIELFYIGFEGIDYKIPILINNFETVISIDSTDLDKTIIKGSLLQKEYTNYLNGLEKAKNKFVYKTNWIQKHNDSPLALIILSKMLGKNKWRLEQNKKAFNGLSDTNKNSKLGVGILSYINIYEAKVQQEKNIAEFSLNPEVDNKTPIKKAITATTVKKEKKLPKRPKAPNFYAESLNGNDISLNEVRKNAKITLIDFWASWCAPCRASNPHLVKLYRKYHKKGFNIISVSEDDINKKQLWKNAIKQDNLTWKHVIDDDARVATMFGVKGIPHTVLIDANGGIIFVKKTPFTIEKKLKEVFGY